MRRGLAPALALAAAACVSLEPRPDRTRYFVLEARGSAPDAARPALPALGVAAVRLPPYLDRREIVTRLGPAQVDVASTDRWAAPLEALFASALGEALRAAVPAREIVAEPWPAGAAPEWSVSVEVLRFEAEADGTAVLEARWTLRRRGAPAGQGVTTVREPAPARDVAAAVSALSRTLGALARDVSAGLDAARADGRAATP